MEAVSDSGLGDSQVMCIGLPDHAVRQIARLLGNGVIVTAAIDTKSAMSALATHANQAAMTSPSEDLPLRTRGFRIDANGRRVLAGETDLMLSCQEYELFNVLHSEPGRAWSYDELSIQVWGHQYLGDPDTIATAVRRLRKRLVDSMCVRITAVRGYGYRFDPA